MKKVLLFGALVSSTLLSASSTATPLPKVTPLHYATTPTHTTNTSHPTTDTQWGYTGHQAPQYWGRLHSDFGLCSQGVNQSPIDITPEVTVTTTNLAPLQFDYHANASRIYNTGYSIQVDVDSRSTITLEGTTFTLKQFHFHTPSENHINAKSFPLEAHFVHASPKGKLAVVSVLFELGATNRVLQKILDAVAQENQPHTPSTLSSGQIDLLLPTRKAYYAFNGSLTTPPCTEGVRWMVLKDYLPISKAQVRQFVKLLKHTNNRPTQPLNARQVLE